MMAAEAESTANGVLEVLDKAALRAEALRVEIATMKDQNMQASPRKSSVPYLLGGGATIAMADPGSPRASMVLPESVFARGPTNLSSSIEASGERHAPPKADDGTSLDDEYDQEMAKQLQQLQQQLDMPSPRGEQAHPESWQTLYEQLLHRLPIGRESLADDGSSTADSSQHSEDGAPDLFIFKAHLRQQQQGADGARRGGRSAAGTNAGGASRPSSSTADLRVNEVLEELSALLASPSSAHSPGRRSNPSGGGSNSAGTQPRTQQRRTSAGKASGGGDWLSHSGSSNRRSSTEESDSAVKPGHPSDKDRKLWRRSSMDSSRDEILAHLKLVNESLNKRGTPDRSKAQPAPMQQQPKRKQPAEASPSQRPPFQLMYASSPRAMGQQAGSRGSSTGGAHPQQQQHQASAVGALDDSKYTPSSPRSMQAAGKPADRYAILLKQAISPAQPASSSNGALAHGPSRSSSYSPPRAASWQVSAAAGAAANAASTSPRYADLLRRPQAKTRSYSPGTSTASPKRPVGYGQADVCTGMCMGCGATGAVVPLDSSSGLGHSAISIIPDAASRGRSATTYAQRLQQQGQHPARSMSAPPGPRTAFGQQREQPPARPATSLGGAFGAGVASSSSYSARAVSKGQQEGPAALSRSSSPLWQQQKGQNTQLPAQSSINFAQLLHDVDAPAATEGSGASRTTSISIGQLLRQASTEATSGAGRASSAGPKTATKPSGGGPKWHLPSTRAKTAPANRTTAVEAGLATFQRSKQRATDAPQARKSAAGAATDAAHHQGLFGRSRMSLLSPGPSISGIDVSNSAAAGRGSEGGSGVPHSPSQSGSGISMPKVWRPGGASSRKDVLQKSKAYEQARARLLQLSMDAQDGEGALEAAASDVTADEAASHGDQAEQLPRLAVAASQGAAGQYGGQRHSLAGAAGTKQAGSVAQRAKAVLPGKAGLAAATGPAAKAWQSRVPGVKYLAAGDRKSVAKAFAAIAVTAAATAAAEVEQEVQQGNSSVYDRLYQDRWHSRDRAARLSGAGAASESGAMHRSSSAAAAQSLFSPSHSEAGVRRGSSAGAAAAHGPLLASEQRMRAKIRAAEETLRLEQELLREEQQYQPATPPRSGSGIGSSSRMRSSSAAAGEGASTGRRGSNSMAGSRSAGASPSTNLGRPASPAAAMLPPFGGAPRRRSATGETGRDLLDKYCVRASNDDAEQQGLSLSGMLKAYNALGLNRSSSDRAAALAALMAAAGGAFEGGGADTAQEGEGPAAAGTALQRSPSSPFKRLSSNSPALNDPDSLSKAALLSSGSVGAGSSGIVQALRSASMQRWQHGSSAERQAAHANLLSMPRHKRGSGSYASELATITGGLAPSFSQQLQQLQQQQQQEQAEELAPQPEPPEADEGSNDPTGLDRDSGRFSPFVTQQHLNQQQQQGQQQQPQEQQEQQEQEDYFHMPGPPPPAMRSTPRNSGLSHEPAAASSTAAGSETTVVPQADPSQQTAQLSTLLEPATACSPATPGLTTALPAHNAAAAVDAAAAAAAAMATADGAIAAHGAAVIVRTGHQDSAKPTAKAVLPPQQLVRATKTGRAVLDSVKRGATVDQALSALRIGLVEASAAPPHVDSPLGSPAGGGSGNSGSCVCFPASASASPSKQSAAQAHQAVRFEVDDAGQLWMLQPPARALSFAAQMAAEAAAAGGSGPQHTRALVTGVRLPLAGKWKKGAGTLELRTAMGCYSLELATAKDFAGLLLGLNAALLAAEADGADEHGAAKGAGVVKLVADMPWAQGVQGVVV